MPRPAAFPTRLEARDLRKCAGSPQGVLGNARDADRRVRKDDPQRHVARPESGARTIAVYDCLRLVGFFLAILALESFPRPFVEPGDSGAQMPRILAWSGKWASKRYRGGERRVR